MFGLNSYLDIFITKIIAIMLFFAQITCVFLQMSRVTDISMYTQFSMTTKQSKFVDTHLILTKVWAIIIIRHKKINTLLQMDVYE